MSQMENLDLENCQLEMGRSFSDEFCQDIDTTGINIIEKVRRIIESERQRIRSDAKKSLIEALATENKKKVRPLVRNEYLD